MLDGFDPIAHWPLLNTIVARSSQADLMAIHSRGHGYPGYMTSAGITLIAEASPEADERHRLALTNDMR